MSVMYFNIESFVISKHFKHRYLSVGRPQFSVSLIGKEGNLFANNMIIYK